MQSKLQEKKMEALCDMLDKLAAEGDQKVKSYIQRCMIFMMAGRFEEIKEIEY